jgi:hypothetical protein
MAIFLWRQNGTISRSMDGVIRYSNSTASTPKSRMASKTSMPLSEISDRKEVDTPNMDCPQKNGIISRFMHPFLNNRKAMERLTLLIAFLVSFTQRLAAKRRKKLNLFHGNGARGTDLDATLATQAFIHIYGLGLAVLDFEHVGRTGIDTLSFTVTFAFIDCYLVHGCSLSPPLPQFVSLLTCLF